MESISIAGIVMENCWSFHLWHLLGTLHLFTVWNRSVSSFKSKLWIWHPRRLSSLPISIFFHLKFRELSLMLSHLIAIVMISSDPVCSSISSTVFHGDSHFGVMHGAYSSVKFYPTGKQIKAIDKRLDCWVYINVWLMTKRVSVAEMSAARRSRLSRPLLKAISSFKDRLVFPAVSASANCTTNSEHSDTG